MINLRGKRSTAIVTGASQGIGRAVAHSLSAEGANVILAGRSSDKLDAVLSKLPQSDSNTHYMKLDLANTDDIERFVGEVIEQIGHVDILVNCAAIYNCSSWIDSSTVDFDELYQTNIRGNYALTKKLLPLLFESRGDVVFINSSVTAFDGANVGQYAATKHALTGLANSLRAEVNAKGVRVMSIYPGRTATPLQESIHESEGRTYRPELLLQPDDIAAMVVACLKLPDTAEVTELHIRSKKKL